MKCKECVFKTYYHFKEIVMNEETWGEGCPKLCSFIPMRTTTNDTECIYEPAKKLFARLEALEELEKAANNLYKEYGKLDYGEEYEDVDAADQCDWLSDLWGALYYLKQIEKVE